MNTFKVCLIISLFTCLFVLSGNAQSNLLEVSDLSEVNIDKYSDLQIRTITEKYKDLQIGETEFYQMLSERGLPGTEVEKLKTRIAQLQQSEKNRPEDNVSDKGELQTEKGRFFDKKANKPLMEENNRDLSIFGAELFAQNSLVFEPNLRIPTPASYILGPDDEVILNVFGMSEKKYNLTVNEEGEVYIPNVGPVFVSGLSIEQATQKIKTKLSTTIYRAMSSGQTKMQLSLGKIRSIRVTVIGQAQKPGTFTVSSLTTLYNVLYLCGGPGPKGSYRAIELIRGNEVKRFADLYAFLVKGDQKDNVLLQEGDVIRIPYYKNRVKISGNVKREGKYEMLENETFDKLLDYSGGFDDRAHKTSVTTIRLSDTGRNVIDIQSSQFSVFKTSAGDEYVVRKNRENFKNRVAVSGSVVRPGNYELTEGLTLKSLIEKSGGITEDAHKSSASLFRYEKNRIPTITTVNIDSVLYFNNNILLKNEDSIAIHSIFDFRDSMYVSIEGYIRKPMNIKWRDNMSLKDVILAAGGLTEFGDSMNIEISGRVKNSNVNLADHPEASTKIVSTNQNVMLEPFDFIIVKGISGYVNQRTVLVMGDVKLPGKYILQKSGDKISDIIKRVGGFKASADSSSITIRRPIKSNLSLREREELFQRLLNIDTDSLMSNSKLRNEVYKNYDLISVNITKVLDNPSSNDNLLLEDGDILTIDKNTNLVKISGEVYYPTIVPFQNTKRVKYYIRQAGNYMPSARKMGTMVIYPNGKAKSVRRFLFFKSYPKVTSRSEVFVPQRNKNNKNKLTAGELAVIVSALGVVANFILTLKIK